MFNTTDDWIKYEAMKACRKYEHEAKEAGRRYLEECAELNGVSVFKFVDDMLACEAVGCDDAGSAVMELSVQVSMAVPLEVDISDEHWSQWCDDVIQWCDDVEDEFRTRPRPMKSPDIIGNVCQLENVCQLRKE